MVGSKNAITRPLQLNRLKCRTFSWFEFGAVLAPALPFGFGRSDWLPRGTMDQWKPPVIRDIIFFSHISTKYCFLSDGNKYATVATHFREDEKGSPQRRHRRRNIIVGRNESNNSFCRCKHDSFPRVLKGRWCCVARHDKNFARDH